MFISLNQPTHGWLPCSISIGGREIEFAASNVLNDPLTELLFLAAWSIAPGYSLPPVATGMNPPIVTQTKRAAHFWLEPNWHSLIAERKDENLDLWFVVNHDGGLQLYEHDFSTTHLTLAGEQTKHAFSSTVFSAITELIETVTPEHFTKHWNREISNAVYCDLQQMLSKSSK